MKRDYWLRERSSLYVAPVTLTGEVILDEITHGLAPGTLIGLFHEENGECQIDILEPYVHLFDDLEIPRAAVKSSNITSIGHDPRLSFLDVEFTGGSVYRYYGVPASLFCKFMEADSKGKFLAKEIKEQCPYKKMPDVS